RDNIPARAPPYTRSSAETPSPNASWFLYFFAYRELLGCCVGPQWARALSGASTACLRRVVSQGVIPPSTSSLSYRSSTPPQPSMSLSSRRGCGNSPSLIALSVLISIGSVNNAAQRPLTDQKRWGF